MSKNYQNPDPGGSGTGRGQPGRAGFSPSESDFDSFCAFSIVFVMIFCIWGF